MDYKLEFSGDLEHEKGDFIRICHANEAFDALKRIRDLCFSERRETDQLQESNPDHTIDPDDYLYILSEIMMNSDIPGLYD